MLGMASIKKKMVIRGFSDLRTVYLDGYGREGNNPIQPNSTGSLNNTTSPKVDITKFYVSNRPLSYMIMQTAIYFYFNLLYLSCTGIEMVLVEYF